jgi:hypothetical protein
MDPTIHMLGNLGQIQAVEDVAEAVRIAGGGQEIEERLSWDTLGLCSSSGQFPQPPAARARDGLPLTREVRSS